MMKKLIRTCFSNGQKSKICMKERSCLQIISVSLIAAVMIILISPVNAAVVDLISLLDASGDVTLSPSNTYILASEYYVVRDTIINGGGATIQAPGGPIGVWAAGRTLQLNNCVINGSGWGAVSAKEGSNLVINDCTISCPIGSGIFVSDSSATIGNSTVDQCSFGVNSIDNSVLSLTQVDFSNCDASFQQVGGTLNWNGGTVTQSGGSAIYLNNVEATFSDVEVVQSGIDSIGFNFYGTASQMLHGVTVSGVTFGVLARQGTVTVDQNSSLSCPFPWLSGAGEGVASVEGAVIVIQDSTFTGFENAIDVISNPGNPGSAYVRNCLFIDTEVSALSAKDASYVEFVNCRTEGVKQDGVYLERSPGKIENSELIGCINSGIIISDCSGVIVQNSLVDGSAYSGISVVENSQNVSIVNNTIANNVLANIAVDSGSSVYIQGNLLYGAPGPAANVSFQGTLDVTMDSTFLVDSEWGIEMNASSSPDISLCYVANHNTGGSLVYDNSSVTLQSTIFDSNDLSVTNAYSMFINTGANVTARGCSFTPAGEGGVYNNAGISSDIAYSYWDSVDGPTNEVEGGGSGSRVAWNAPNGSSLVYEPFLTSAPVAGNYTNVLSLSSESTLSWDSTLGVQLELIGKTAIAPLTNKIAGTSRCYDTSYLTTWSFPPTTVSGGVYAVWVDHSLIMDSSDGSLVFYIPEAVGDMTIERREPDGSWVPEACSWDLPSKQITYSPTDLFRLNGTFALVEGTPPTPLSIEGWKYYQVGEFRFPTLDPPLP